MHGRLALAALVTAGAAAAALWALREDTTQPSPAVQPPVSAPPTSQPSAPASGELQTPAADAPAVEPAPSGAAATFPDGSTRPTLNGVPVALSIDWPAGRAYSPVVDVVTNGDGVAFYRHADGSFSTTLSRVESVSGKTVHLASTYTPGPTPSELRLRN